MAFAVIFASAILFTSVFGQSNYANHGNSVEFNPGLPEQATLDGKVTQLDELSPVIFLNRTKAALNCAAGTMEAELKFEEPFYGIAYADFNRNSPCSVAGNGNFTYRIEMPLKGCGTKQDPQRVFTNNIVVRFHPSLEMDGDEVITIVCRYPPPIAPLPPALPELFQELPPAVPIEPPLKGFQVLLVICAILFLSLVLLGLAASYYCLSRRRLAVIRRRPATVSLAGSEITKLSGSTLGSISLFEGLKIPRAVVVAQVAASSSISGSEAALIIDDHSDTLPSDYPSESPSSAHSEVEAATTMRRPPSEVSSAYDASACIEESMMVHNQIITPPPPQFDVSVRVKRAAPTPPPRTSSTGTSTPCSTPPPMMAPASERITTTFEREVKTMTPPSPVHMATAHLNVQPDIQPTVTITARPPVYSRIMRNRKDSLTTLNTENTDTHSVSEIAVEDNIATIELEPPVIALRKPEITQHVVDDVFLRTITEKRIIEDIERRKREVTEFHARVPPPINFDVAIRTYPDPNAEQWDHYSTASSSTMLSEAPVNNTYINSLERTENYTTTMNIPVPERPIPNWDVLIRVLEQPESLQSPQLVNQQQAAFDDRASISSLTSILTEADREKWRQIITTESTLRTLLTEATVREDFERIRHDQRYEQLFEPAKWDVIIRVLAPPPDEEEHIRIYEQNRSGSSGKYRRQLSKDSNWDTRSRRSSLPTLYESDTDVGSSISGVQPSTSSKMRKLSRSSNEMDVRSMSEFTVHDQYRRDDFAYSDVDDHLSLGSSSGAHLVRSSSQPSLARSASEFTERRWALESNAMISSPEQTPVMQRRVKSSELLMVQTGEEEQTTSYTRSATSVRFANEWDI